MDKIQRTTIIGPKKMGGMGLMQVKAKLCSIKLMWFGYYQQGIGKWKSFFDFWIRQAGSKHYLGWYVLDKAEKCAVNTTCFYRDLLNYFDVSRAKLKPEFSTVLEIQSVPLWENTIVCADTRNDMHSKVMISAGYYKVKDVIRNNRLITFRELARMCRIKPINAGRIVSLLRKNINPSFVMENRCGPPNHPSNWVGIELGDGKNFRPVCELSSKDMYRFEICRDSLLRSLRRSGRPSYTYQKISTGFPFGKVCTVIL